MKSFASHSPNPGPRPGSDSDSHSAPSSDEGENEGAAVAPFPAKRIAAAWGRLMEEMSRRPELWLAAAQEAQTRQLQVLSAMSEDPKKTVVDPKPGDRRFNGAAWRESPFHAFLMQSYLVNSDLTRRVLREANLSAEDRKLLQFVVNQQINALSPANFPAANPEVLQAAVQSGGQSLLDGAQNFARDLQNKAVQNTDTTAFQIGRDLASAPGKIVADNGVMQLIQYAPQTPKTRAKPLLIVPPCINKYYILDLQPQNSLVRHMTQNGFTVFLVSWVNAGAEHSRKTWDDYLRLGVMDPLEIVRAIRGRDGVNAMGFCVGGTLLACAQAVLAAEGKRGADSLTLLTTLLDFSDPGEIGLFIDDDVVAEYESRFAEGGLLDGRDLARGFAALRPNDLIWPYVIGNYYKGESPPAFDLLFWNADSTNLPGPMFAEYLRQTYLENRLARGGKQAAEMCGARVDLKKLTLPTFVVASERDHIVPWQSAYAGAKLLGGSPQFTLSSSGHIAGIVNPPSAKKGWRMSQPAQSSASDSKGKVSDSKSKLPDDPDKWRATAAKKDGSWWDDWAQWLAKRSGKMIPAPKKFGDARYPPLCDAPGDYVRAPRPEVSDNGAENPAPGFGFAAPGFGGGFPFPFNFPESNQPTRPGQHTRPNPPNPSNPPNPPNPSSKGGTPS